ncbi:hypothetical protein M2306_002403 [Myroides gitamensis]|uniref:DUF6089 domain-containing protein n=1 Tax=Myroides odoratus TaxID=256 RepID=A0A378U3Y8_MYROD|nr:DUF6089 family protein [Myroides odoratus]MCS4237551.1 hypothetical protein [Myroides odoratus]MDH6601709.1 hypothetical protein [Myroides gitamensis]QQU02918.1 outer membrane beta-barrel protein [Myroides odoratus]STZ69847.1 Uncharacterised protein [Myroides odoratus]
MKKALITFILLLTMPLAYAQIHEVGFGLGGTNYVGDIGSAQFINPKNIGYNVFYRWNKSPRHSYRLSFSQHKLTGNDADASSESRKERGLRFDNTLQQLSLGIEFNFFEFDLHQENFAMTPYLYAGLSGIRYSDIYHRNKKMIKGDKKYNAAIPFAAGMKIRVNPQININAEVTATYTFTDNLDGSHPTSSSTKRYRFGKSGNDWFFYSGITISYTFGHNPCYCAD